MQECEDSIHHSLTVTVTHLSKDCLAGGNLEGSCELSQEHVENKQKIPKERVVFTFMDDSTTTDGYFEIYCITFMRGV